MNRKVGRVKKRKPFAESALKSAGFTEDPQYLKGQIFREAVLLCFGGGCFPTKLLRRSKKKYKELNDTFKCPEYFY